MKLGHWSLTIARLVPVVLALALLGCTERGKTPGGTVPASGREIVALVTVEGLGRSWDRTVPAEVAPVLRSLSQGNAPAVFTPCPSLVPALASLMSGTEPGEHGVHDNFGSRVPATVRLLAEELKAAGWRTGAFVANPLLARITELDRGFEVFDGSSADVLGSSRYYPEVRRAPGIVENAALWVASIPAGERIFLWIHLSELGEPRLAGVEGALPGPRERFAAVDAAVGRVRNTVRSDGNRGVLFVTSDRGLLTDPEGDLGQGFFLEPAAVAVYYAEEPFGGSTLTPERRPRILSQLHDRILESASLAPGPAESSAPKDSSAPLVVSSSSIPWNWGRWPAAVVVHYQDSLWLYDGTWRRSTDLGAAASCPDADVPAGVRLAAEDESSRLQAIAPAGPRLQALQTASRKAGLRIADEDRVASRRSLSERRRLIGRLQRARFLASQGQFTPAVQLLSPLLKEPAPLPAAMVDAVMFETLGPEPSGRDWELGTRALARFGPLPPALHWTAHAALRRKDPQLAEALLQAFLERVPDDPDALYDLACIRSLGGDITGADALLRAAARRGFHAWDFVEVDPDLRNFRADPKYAELRKSVGR